ncbi:MAG: hypothetical protein IIA70_06930 [Proteobacteria bacterium]|nr:hypothetical protein [Pseudomonadota bacterium]
MNEPSMSRRQMLRQSAAAAAGSRITTAVGTAVTDDPGPGATDVDCDHLASVHREYR